MSFGISIRDQVGLLGTQSTDRLFRLRYVGTGGVTIPGLVTSGANFNALILVRYSTRFGIEQNRYNQSTQFLAALSSDEINIYDASILVFMYR